MSRKHHLLVNLIFDPQYNGYVADVPQLPGCMSQGKTVEAALKNIGKAVNTYLRAAGFQNAFIRGNPFPVAQKQRNT